MPTFDFTSPDGKSYSVDGPDGATPDQAFQMLQQHLSAPQVGMAEDAARSVGSGLANATAGTFGMAGDIRSGLSSATDYLGSKLGASPDKVQAFKDLTSKAAGMTGAGAVLNNAPTSRDIINSAPDAMVSPDYQPQTTLGGVLKKGAEFAPNMIMGGPEGLAARFATNVAAPAIGSEIGEHVAGPLGGIAGALAGGIGATSAARKFQEMAAARNAAKALPTGEDLLKSGSNGFEAVKASDAIIKPSSVEQMAKDIKTELLNEGYHPTSEGQAATFNALDRLEKMGSSSLKGEDDVANILHLLENPNALTPGGVTTKDMEVIRKNLVNEKMSTNPAAAGAARMASNSFMDKYSNLAQSDLLNGSNPFPTLKNAIGDWAAGKRSNTIQGKADLAALNSGTAGSGANQDNNLRQAIKQLARPMNNTNVPVAKKLGFNDAEIEAIKQAATGTATGNTARYLGKYAPTGIVSAAGGAGLGHLVGGPAGAAIPVVGYIAKKIGDLSTKRAVQAIDSLVRSRSPLAAHVAAQLPPQIISQMPAKSQRILQSLALTMPQIRDQISQPVGQPVGQSNTY